MCDVINAPWVRRHMGEETNVRPVLVSHNTGHFNERVKHHRREQRIHTPAVSLCCLLFSVVIIHCQMCVFHSIPMSLCVVQPKNNLPPPPEKGTEHLLRDPPISELNSNIMVLMCTCFYNACLSALYEYCISIYCSTNKDHVCFFSPKSKTPKAGGWCCQAALQLAAD